MLGNNRGTDYDVIDTATGDAVLRVRYLTPTEPDCCMCGRSTFDHFAVPYYCGPVRSGKSEGGYAPACQRCYDRWARWDDGLEEYDSWLPVLRTSGVAIPSVTDIQFKLIDAKNALQHAADATTPEVAEVYRRRAQELAEIVSALARGVGEVRSQVSGGQVMRDGNEP